MSASNFSTKNQTYRQLIGNGLIYRVPRFQRDYNWTPEEWDDLWQDILNVVEYKTEVAHYMGYLVLQTSDEKNFDVIDGQQRLTTLSLFVLAVMKHLNELVTEKGAQAENDAKRLEQLRQTYIGYLNPVTLLSQNKLILNRNNDYYYRTHLVSLEPKPPARKIKETEANLRKASEWFYKHIHQYLQEKNSNDNGKVLASLVDEISDALFFTVINVTDELNAYKVFETLNARGVRLSSSDLLKNYLFSVVGQSEESEQEMNALDERWEKLLSKLGDEKFPDFLRTHWISRHHFVRHNDLFKKIRASILDSGQVFSLLHELEEDLDLYLNFISPDYAGWQGKLLEYAHLLKLFKVRQQLPFLLAARRFLTDDKDFEKIMRACVVITFRYNVIGQLHTNETERVYAQAAEQIQHRLIENTNQLLKLLQNIYVPDESFFSAFREKSINTNQSRNNQIVKYILAKLDKQENQSSIDEDDPDLTVEHILPQNPDERWGQFNNEDIEELVYRLGNMVLLHKTLNHKLQNRPFIEKKPKFLQSDIVTTKTISKFEEWTPKEIRQRQHQMAKLAKTIWRIDELST